MEDGKALDERLQFECMICYLMLYLHGMELEVIWSCMIDVYELACLLVRQTKRGVSDVWRTVLLQY